MPAPMTEIVSSAWTCANCDVSRLRANTDVMASEDNCMKRRRESGVGMVGASDVLVKASSIVQSCDRINLTASAGVIR